MVKLYIQMMEYYSPIKRNDVLTMLQCGMSFETLCYMKKAGHAGHLLHSVTYMKYTEWANP